MRYVYSAIRFVPDPVRGEFVNFGVIVGSDETGEWDLRVAGNQKRARRLDDNGVLPALLQFTNEIGQRVDRSEDAALIQNDVALSEAWLTKIWEEYNNVVQLSRPAPIAASSIEDALATAFTKLVVDPETSTLTYKRKTTAVSALRRAYVDAGIRKGSHLLESTAVRVDKHVEDFDFAVANGKVLQLSQAWSFQLPNQKELSESVKAFAWTVEHLRKSGGVALTAQGNQIDVPHDVEVAALYIPPRGEHGAFDEAVDAFREVSVELVEIGEEARVGTMAKQRLGALAAH